MHGIMAFGDYALGADTHTAQFADKSKCKKPCSMCGSYLDQHVPGAVSVACSFKSIDQKDKLAYNYFVVQYTPVYHKK